MADPASLAQFGGLNDAVWPTILSGLIGAFGALVGSVVGAVVSGKISRCIQLEVINQQQIRAKTVDFSQSRLVLARLIFKVRRLARVMEQFQQRDMLEPADGEIFLPPIPVQPVVESAHEVFPFHFDADEVAFLSRYDLHMAALSLENAYNDCCQIGKKLEDLQRSLDKNQHTLLRNEAELRHMAQHEGKLNQFTKESLSNLQSENAEMTRLLVTLRKEVDLNVVQFVSTAEDGSGLFESLKNDLERIWQSDFASSDLLPEKFRAS